MNCIICNVDSIIDPLNFDEQLSAHTACIEAMQEDGKSLPVKAKRVGLYGDLKNPGDFFLMEDANGVITHIAYICPCGKCGYEYRSALPLSTDPHQGHPRWEWDGNKDEPTLTPSIQRRLHIHAYEDHPEYKCDWHGFLTNGVFKSC